MALIPTWLQYIKPFDEFPEHITYNDFQKLLIAILDHFAEKGHSYRREYEKERDLLFLRLLWECGGRVSDVLNITVANINFNKKMLDLYVQKRNKYIQVPLFKAILNELKVFIEKWKKKRYIFTAFDVDKPLTRQNAWKKVKKYGKLIGLELNPHKFRHGLAKFLLENGKDIPFITARLGHSSPLTTIMSYLKVTPEMQRRALADLFEIKDIADLR